MGVKVLGFAHNLNFSLNKKRMEMMKKEKSPGVNKMKLLLALPVIALLVFAFAQPEYVAVNEIPSTESDLTNNVSETVLVKGFVKTEDGLPLVGASIVLKKTTIGTITDSKGNFEINAPKDGILVVSYIGYETQSINIKSSGNTSGFIGVKMKEGIFNILFPENNEKMNEPNTTPPPPPAEKSGEEIMVIVEDMPIYKNGGLNQLGRDIQEEAGKVMKTIQDRGEAMVGFTVSAEGKVTNLHIIKSAKSKQLDDSALKIIQKLDNWTPGVQRGKPVKVNLSVPVKFE